MLLILTQQTTLQYKNKVQIDINYNEHFSFQLLKQLFSKILSFASLLTLISNNFVWALLTRSVPTQIVCSMWLIMNKIVRFFNIHLQDHNCFNLMKLMIFTVNAIWLNA